MPRALNKEELREIENDTRTQGYIPADDLFYRFIITIRAKDEELAALRTLVIAQSESMELFASCIDDAEIERLRKIENAAREYVKSRSVNDMRDTLNALERAIGVPHHD